MIKFLTDRLIPRKNLYAEMGLGKTVCVGTMITELNLRHVLVVGPKRVAADVWPADFAKWDHLAGIEICPILGDRDQRMFNLLAPPRVSTINYDNLPWLIRELGDQFPFSTIIADESARLRGFRTKQGRARAAALGNVAYSRVKVWVNLSGTPVPRGYEDLWGPQWFIDGGIALGLSYKAFMMRWFYRPVDGSQGYGKVLPLPGAAEQIQARIRPTTLSVRASDWLDVKEPQVSPVYVELPPGARHHYEQMRRTLVTQVQAGLVTASNAGVKSIKLLQIASGCVYLEGGLCQVLHDEKLDALESILVEAAGGPVLCSYWWAEDWNRIKARFPKAVNISEPGAVERWNNGSVNLLCANPKSAGHGLNLQDGGHILTYFTDWWDLELHQQILERIGPVRQLQSGHNRVVWVRPIIARRTVDEQVLRRHETRGSVMDLFMRALSV
jgi:hypothetical protein